MPRITRRSVLAAAAGLSVQAPPAPRRAPPITVLIGSVTNAMWPIGDVAALERGAVFARSLGVDAFQSYTPWSVLEPARAGTFDWTETDKLDGICRRAGLKWQPMVMLNPSYATPAWFRQSGEDVPHRCLEHGQDSDVRSIWLPGLERHVERVIAGLFGRYGRSPALESVNLGVSGDFGESLFPAGAVGWNGHYHNHQGFWCAEEPAVAAFQAWAKVRFGAVARLNSAWGERLRSFSEVRFELPSRSMSDARWLNQAEWYRGEMTRWCETWFLIARRHAPSGLPLYLCVGGVDSVPLGFDITGQVRAAARYRVGLRLTNEGSVYGANFMGTRQLTTAAKLYGVPYGLEPAGEVNVRGITARIFGAAAAGCEHIHFYEGQIASFGASAPAEGRTEAWNRGREHLVRKRPYVNVAAFFPRVDALCKREMSTESLRRYEGLRDLLDFDIVDDNLARDGKLGRYRYILLGPCSALDSRAYAALIAWVRGGGVLIASEQRVLRAWEPERSAFRAVRPLAPRAQRWASARLEMPARWTIHPGRPPAGPELTGTWSHPEGDRRWGGQDAGLRVTVDPALRYRVSIHGGVPVGGAVLVNGREVGRIEGAAGNEHTWSFAVPAAALQGGRALHLQFRMAPLRLAADPRDLCVFPSAIVIEAEGGNAALEQPRWGAWRIDRARLAASTLALGRGRVVALPEDGMQAAERAGAMLALLRTGFAGVPACALPDGVPDGLYVALRGDELLVFNGADRPVTAELRLAPGAELERGLLAAGQTIAIRTMPPDTIRAYPLRLRQIPARQSGRGR